MMNIGPPYDFAEIARLHVKTILGVRPHGPYVVGGFSAGGPLAYEIAQQLIADGHEVALLALFDSSCPVQPNVSSARRKLSNVRIHLRELQAIGVNEYWAYLAPVLERRVQALKNQIRSVARGVRIAPPEPPPGQYADPSLAFQESSRAYCPRPYPGRAILFKRTRWISSRFVLPDCGWGAFISNGFEVCIVPGDHFAMFVEPGVAILANKLRSILDEVSGDKPPSDASVSNAGASYGSSPGQLAVVTPQRNGSGSAVSPLAAVSDAHAHGANGNREAATAHWPIQPLGKRPPLYVMGSFNEFIPLAWRLGLDQPVLGVSIPNELKLRIPYQLEELAAAQVESIIKGQPLGPYFLAGFSAEGVLAFEVARQLTASGREVGLVVMVDSPCPAEPDPFLIRIDAQCWNPPDSNLARRNPAIATCRLGNRPTPDSKNEDTQLAARECLGNTRRQADASRPDGRGDGKRHRRPQLRAAALLRACVVVQADSRPGWKISATGQWMGSCGARGTRGLQN